MGGAGGMDEGMMGGMGGGMGGMPGMGGAGGMGGLDFSVSNPRGCVTKDIP